MDVKIAKPRNETSPNFKAFRSTETESTKREEIPAFEKLLQNVKDVSTNESDLFSPLTFSNNLEFAKEHKNYFSLGNTFNKAIKIKEHDRLNAFIHRFSEQLDDEYKCEERADDGRRKVSAGNTGGLCCKCEFKSQRDRVFY